jgi:hypothetical protein
MSNAAASSDLIPQRTHFVGMTILGIRRGVDPTIMEPTPGEGDIAKKAVAWQEM